MRTIVAFICAANVIAGTAEAGDLRQSMAGRLSSIQANAAEAAVEPPKPNHAARAAVAQGPLAAALGVTPVEAAPAETFPAPAPAPSSPAQALPPALMQADPIPAPPPSSAQTPPQTVPTDPAAPMFAIPGEQLAAIGVGVIGGLIILDTIGVPSAAAAFVGGLAGQWWYSSHREPVLVNRVWRDVAVRDSEAINRRWLRPVRDSRDN